VTAAESTTMNVAASAAIPEPATGAGPAPSAPAPGVRGLSLRRNFSWTLVGNVAYAASQWAILVLLARLGSPDMVGRFAMGLAIATPVMLFAGLALRQLQVVDVARQYAFGHYLALRLVTAALGALVVAGIALSAGFARETVAAAIVLGVAKGVESVSDIFYGAFQHYERLDRIAWSMMLKGGLALPAFAAGLYLGKTVAVAVACMGVAWLVVLLAYDVPQAHRLLRERGDRIPPRFDLPALGRLVRMALPVGLIMVLISLQSNLPRYFIEHRQGLAALGIFSALSYVTVAVTQVVAALGQSASPRLARLYQGGDAAGYARLVLKLVAVGGAIGAAGVLAAAVAGRPILHLIYGPEYAPHTATLVVLMAGAMVVSMTTFVAHASTAARYFKSQAGVLVASCAAGLALCAVLVPRYGLPGGAWAVLLSYAAYGAGCAALVAHAYRRLRRSR
jgi:O-antigen/teichoic acid export membrane protein